jgi:hypothetical protein
MEEINKTSTWWINEDMDGEEVDDLLNDDIAKHADKGYALVSVNLCPVDRTTVAILHFRKQ